MIYKWLVDDSNKSSTMDYLLNKDLVVVHFMMIYP